MRTKTTWTFLLCLVGLAGVASANDSAAERASLTGLTKNSGDLLIAIITGYQNSSGAGAPGGRALIDDYEARHGGVDRPG